MTRVSHVCLVLWVLAVPLGALAEDPPNSNPTVQELLERIRKLEQRVEELEKKQAEAAPGPAPTTAVAAPTPSAPGTPPARAQAPGASREPMAHEGPVMAGEAQPQYPSLSVHGFTNIDFSAQDKKGTTSGFKMGQFVLHASGALSERVSYFSELSLSATPTGYNAEVERSLIRFDYSDYFKISFGRYHTPINYWNTAFHHGLWLQTTVDRPEMIQFGGRLIPVHFIGALVEGTVPGSGSLNLNYNLGLGNGRGSTISRAGDAGDINNNRAWLVSLFAKPDWAYRWQAGAAVYRDRIELGKEGSFAEWIETAHLVYTKETPEFLSEFANIRHNGLGQPGVFNSQAWYVQLGYRLPWFEKVWKPYYRFEYIHIPKGDPVFNPKANPLPSLAGSVLGLRYDITSYAAIKAEYRNSRRASKEPRINGAFLQTSLTF